MKKSIFQNFEEKALENEQKMNVIGGRVSGEKTTQTCYEPTNNGSDMTVESWPDEGGQVTSFTYRLLSH